MTGTSTTSHNARHDEGATVNDSVSTSIHYRLTPASIQRWPCQCSPKRQKRREYSDRPPHLLSTKRQKCVRLHAHAMLFLQFIYSTPTIRGKPKHGNLPKRKPILMCAVDDHLLLELRQCPEVGLRLLLQVVKTAVGRERESADRRLEDLLANSGPAIVILASVALLR